jgi:hypothetical protein
MRYDPDALPFWEIGDGGPITDRIASARRIQARARLKWINEEIRLFVHQVQPSSSQVMKDQLERMRSERDKLREELGLIRLVRAA